MSKNEVHRPFLILSLLVGAAGLSAFGLTLIVDPLGWSAAFLILLVLAVISENFALAVPGYSLSLVYPLTIAAAIALGPASAAVIAATTAVNLMEIKDHVRASVVFFNLGQLLITTCGAAWVYRGIGGRVLLSGLVGRPFGVHDFPVALIAVVGMAIVGAALNVLLSAQGYATKNGESVREVLVANRWLVPMQTALAAVGFLIAQVIAIDVLVLPLFVFPFIVARDLYQRFKSLKDAYADTIRSLVSALEAKDPYTRGHSERVAQYAVTIGRAMSLDAKSCERLEYAGLLHDLGKVALPQDILTKPGRLTDDEMQMMKGHPAAGASMVERIPPLAELAHLVMQHHERYEGNGYPLGSVGDGAPLLSRVLTVADAYDAMTSNRAYRAAMTHARARAILHEESGKQFDPSVVLAFSTTWSEEDDVEACDADTPNPALGAESLPAESAAILAGETR